MRQNISMHRVSAVALACALAAPSIASAQEADPATPTVVTAPVAAEPTPAAPVTDTAPPAAVQPETTAAEQPVTTAVESPERTKVAKVPVKSAPRAVAKSAPTPAPSDANPVAAPLAAAGPEDPLATSPQEIAQAADAQAIPAAPVADEQPSSDAVVFGGALALLIAAGGALGFARRRKHVIADADEELPVVAAAPIHREVDLSPPPVAAAPIERSAFSWGDSTRATTLSPVEQAMRGPTPDNPSLSLKKRLKRAHFFEQREREAASGKAVAVPRSAGLPTRLLDTAPRTASVPRREFEYA